MLLIVSIGFIFINIVHAYDSKQKPQSQFMDLWTTTRPEDVKSLALDKRTVV